MPLHAVTTLNGRVFGFGYKKKSAILDFSGLVEFDANYMKQVTRCPLKMEQLEGMQEQTAASCAFKWLWLADTFLMVVQRVNCADEIYMFNMRSRRWKTTGYVFRDPVTSIALGGDNVLIVRTHEDDMDRFYRYPLRFDALMQHFI